MSLPDQQFYLKTLAGSGGAIDFPYNPDVNNRYGVSSTDQFVYQCRLNLQREAADNGETFNGSVIDYTDSVRGSMTKVLNDDDAAMIIPGDGVYTQDFALIRLEAIGSEGTKGSDIDFNYGAHAFAEFVLGTDLAFGTSSLEWNLRLSNENEGNAYPGAYCIIPDVETNDDGALSQTIDCYFPCNLE